MAQDAQSEEAVEPTTEERQRATQRALRHRAELFARLSAFEPFQELLRELDRKEERIRKSYLGRLMAGEELNQRQIDCDRGFVDGMRYVRQVVSAAENTLEKADAAADAAAESEPDDERSLW